MDHIIRIGKIGFVYSKTNNKYEVVCYYPNPNYKKKGDTIKVTDRMYKYPGNNVYIDESCFENEECNYVLAFVDKTKEGYDMRTVGSRPFALGNSDRIDFLHVSEQGFRWLYDRDEKEDGEDGDYNDYKD
jgi:hypothetical protein